MERCWGYVGMLQDPQAWSCPVGGPWFDPPPSHTIPSSTNLRSLPCPPILNPGGGRKAVDGACSLQHTRDPRWISRRQTPLLLAALFSFGLLQWGCLNLIDLRKQKTQSTECQITHRVASPKQARKKHPLLLCKKSKVNQKKNKSLSALYFCDLEYYGSITYNEQYICFSFL